MAYLCPQIYFPPIKSLLPYQYFYRCLLLFSKRNGHSKASYSGVVLYRSIIVCNVPFPKLHGITNPTFCGSTNTKAETMRRIGEHMKFNVNAGGFHGVYTPFHCPGRSNTVPLSHNEVGIHVHYFPISQFQVCEAKRLRPVLILQRCFLKQ